MKEVSLIMVKNKITESSYVESAWESREDAEAHLNWMKNKVLKQNSTHTVWIEIKQLYKHLG